jgi:hypothetical protein
VKPNRFIDALADWITNLEILRRKPAAYSFVLEVSLKAFGKFLVLR